MDKKNHCINIQSATDEAHVSKLEAGVIESDDATTAAHVEALDGMAFDEMNLVELPFALLTDARDATTHPIAYLPLSAGGNERLVTSAGSSLPTALAERVVLALLWMTMAQNSFKSPVIRFSLRHLIHEFMYPQRLPSNRVGGSFFKRVEQEIRHIAHTRIVSSRWYDKALKRATHMDASIIDYLQVIEEGGRNKPRILEIRWGDKLFKSVRDRYTKSLDVRTVLQIDRPLDLRFFRWLDRQLTNKTKEIVISSQSFARYKMLMRGQKIDRGGRTASNYIVAKLKESIERLQTIGFYVNMTVDESRADFRLEFERLTPTLAHHPAPLAQASEENVNELGRIFQRLAHKLPDNSAQMYLAPGCRDEAQRWLADYGLDQAKWMIERCIELHKASGQGDRTLFTFKGLKFYESKAVADYQRSHGTTEETPAQIRAQAREAWEIYRDNELTKARAELSTTQLNHLEAEVTREIADEYQGKAFKPSGLVLRSLVQVALDSRILEHAKAYNEEQFFSTWMQTHQPMAVAQSKARRRGSKQPKNLPLQ